MLLQLIIKMLSFSSVLEFSLSSNILVYLEIIFNFSTKRVVFLHVKGL